MSTDPLHIDLPAPKYRVGTMVIALVNHQPRYAQIEQARLDVHLVLTEAGMHTEGVLRWEYDVRLFNEPIEASENMIIAERTIITEVGQDGRLGA